MKPWAQKIETILTNAHGEGREQLFEHEVYSILSHLGITTPNHSFARHEEEITSETLSSFGSSRIVLKVVSRHITHKQKA
ncbi:MAG: acetate--CoA ligase family protein, partial [Spirochaetes bacterium]|nr:acetate--CoA ligase family protein [Spirochaetota bacterium]